MKDTWKFIRSKVYAVFRFFGLILVANWKKLRPELLQLKELGLGLFQKFKKKL